jgi:hypothetical protein
VNPRPIAGAALLTTAAGVLYTGVVAVSGTEPAAGWLIQAVLHLGELLVVVALALSFVSTLARMFLGLAVVGQLSLAVAEVVWPGNASVGDTLFGVGPTLTGIGLIGAGISILRAGRWTGWRRFLPLGLGLYIFVVMTPALIVSGGPPAPVALAVLAGWDVLWALIAGAALSLHLSNQRTSEPQPPHAQHASLSVHHRDG